MLGNCSLNPVTDLITGRKISNYKKDEQVQYATERQDRCLPVKGAEISTSNNKETIQLKMGIGLK